MLYYSYLKILKIRVFSNLAGIYLVDFIAVIRSYRKSMFFSQFLVKNFQSKSKKKIGLFHSSDT